MKSKINKYNGFKIESLCKAIKQIIATLVGNIVRKTWLTNLLLLITLTESQAQEGNKSLSFNGTSSKITFINNDLQLSNNYQMAFGAWVNWGNKANAGHNAVIVSVSDSTGNNGQFWLQHDYNNDHFQFMLQTDSGKKLTITGTSTVTEGNWYYVMGVFNVGRVELYVNGLLEAYDTLIAGTLINSYNNGFKARVGNSIDEQCGFNGLIDELSVWNNLGIDSAGAMDNLLVKLTGHETALYSLWNMDSLLTTTLVADLGINQANGILFNVGQVNFGAPLGQKSTFVPFDSVSNSFKFYGRNADSLIVDSLVPHVTGVYVYEVQRSPIDSTLPPGAISDSAGYYYGVFVPGFDTGSYKIECYINPNDSGPGKRTTSSFARASSMILERNNQSPVNWINTGIAYNSNAAFVTTNHHQWCEYSVGNANTTQIFSQNNFTTLPSVYPNPFSSSFMLNLEVLAKTTVRISVTDANGILIKEGTHLLNQGRNEVYMDGLSDLASGLYFAKIIDNEGNTYTTKVVKQR